MAQINLTKADQGRTVEVPRGTVLVIQLEENPTTGYRWAVEQADTERLELLNADYAMAADTGVGGGGGRTFAFRAVRGGTTPLRLKHWRAWEGDASIIERLQVTVRVLD